jgi:hypothetical protein
MSEEQLLSNAKPEEYFVLKNGRVLKNLYELTNSLTSMDDDTFSHHVNNEKNDFANWVRHVFHDEQLADTVLRRKSKKSILKAINKRLSKIGKEDKKEKKRFNLIPALIPKKQENRIEDNIIQEKKADINNSELSKKLDEILTREREIEYRERKIEEVEEQIEERIMRAKKENKESGFFSKEFLQGLAIGLLLALILGLIYFKFYY